MGSVLLLSRGLWLDLIWDTELERDREMDHGRSIMFISARKLEVDTTGNTADYVELEEYAST